jgi:hypothetical protein
MALVLRQCVAKSGFFYIAAAGLLTLTTAAAPARAGDVMQPRAGAGDVARHPASPVEQAYHAGKAARDDDAKRGFYQRGIALARASLASAPDDPDALLWLSANLGGEALTHGKLSALHAVPEIEATLLHLERVAPAYEHAAAARALGNLYWKAPSVLSVGSSKKAATYFRLALARDATYPGNQAHAAAFFADQHDCATARPLADAVARRPDLDAFGTDAAEWRALAERALHDCGGAR